MPADKTKKYEQLLQKIVVGHKEKYGWTYTELSNLLRDEGFDVSDKNLGKKLRTGIISGQLLLAILWVKRIPIMDQRALQDLMDELK